MAIGSAVRGLNRIVPRLYTDLHAYHFAANGAYLRYIEKGNPNLGKGQFLPLPTAGLPGFEFAGLG